jgi:hypothetical protein
VARLERQPGIKTSRTPGALFSGTRSSRENALSGGGRGRGVGGEFENRGGRACAVIAFLDNRVTARAGGLEESQGAS